MIGKERPILTMADELNTLLERQQTLPGMWPTGRIEMVGTRLGRVAAGIFPNDSLKSVHIIVADLQKEELTAHITTVDAAEATPQDFRLYTVQALIGDRLYKPSGLGERYVQDKNRRVELSLLGSVLRRVAQSGSAYDPFQNEELAGHLVMAVDSSPAMHPAVKEAIRSLG